MMGSKGNFAVQERQRRIKMVIGLLNKIKSEDKQISHKKLKGQLGIKFGLSSRKISEYLEQLSDAGIIEVNAEDDLILFKGG